MLANTALRVFIDVWSIGITVQQADECRQWAKGKLKEHSKAKREQRLNEWVKRLTFVSENTCTKSETDF